ncbi:electron transport complex subunit RsxG [Endozoicomonas sp. Mp262]|uniref:electron transport complex subunit RsxG n=1 Tax=Endozoicomonas sp. Mp262 TaxID=2919499 RepID=UPI0021DF6A30
MSENTSENQPGTMATLFQSMVRNSLGLGLFSILTVGLISLTYVLTGDKIEEQVRNYEAKALIEILPAETHDNVLLDTAILLKPSKLLATQREKKAYIALNRGVPTAVILPAVAPDGYNGRIELLVGVNRDGTLAGVRVVTHKETPGLGDKIDTKITHWILGFTGKSLTSPGSSGWAVKKDGGQFDQFTGATITPRAVVAAVYRTLKYFKANKDFLLSPDNLEGSSL